MQSFTRIAACAVAAVAVVTTYAAPQESRVSVSFPAATAAPALPMKATVAKTVSAAAAVAALTPAKPAVIRLEPSASAMERALRQQIKFETVQWGGKELQTLDEASRVKLAKAAAEKARLHEVGLTYHDVYGIIEAETSWVQRTGASKNGTPNLGLAQFEPATAAGLGIADPSDPIQAVFGAAVYMKSGAKWASSKLAALKLSPEEHAAKLREGVSIHYNLSVKGRNKWDGRNAGQLPVETQRHIRNARAGAAEAAQLSKLLKA